MLRWTRWVGFGRAAFGYWLRTVVGLGRAFWAGWVAENGVIL